MKKIGRSLLGALICATLSGTVSRGDDGWKTTPVAHLQTDQGLLQIDQVGTYGHRVSLDGRFIAELEAGGVSITKSVVSPDAHQYVLLTISKGGGSCAQLYRLVDLLAGQKPYVTGEFGNCTFDPVFRIQDNSVTIDFPESPIYKARAYTYDPARKSLTSRTSRP